MTNQYQPTAEPSRVFQHVSKFIPYFANPEHVLLLKLDVMLLLWMFIAGVRIPAPMSTHHMQKLPYCSIINNVAFVDHQRT